MKRILFDVNVILDVLLDRSPHAEASAAVWAVAETGTVEGMVAAHGVTTIHYLLRKGTSTAKAKEIVSASLKVFGIAAVDRPVIEEALRMNCSDFENAVTVAAARLAAGDYIVTKDPKGFRESPVRVLTPEATLPILSHESPSKLL